MTDPPASAMTPVFHCRIGDWRNDMKEKNGRIAVSMEEIAERLCCSYEKIRGFIYSK